MACKPSIPHGMSGGIDFIHGPSDRHSHRSDSCLCSSTSRRRLYSPNTRRRLRACCCWTWPPDSESCGQCSCAPSSAGLRPPRSPPRSLRRRQRPAPPACAPGWGGGFAQIVWKFGQSFWKKIKLLKYWFKIAKNYFSSASTEAKLRLSLVLKWHGVCPPHIFTHYV